LARVEPLRIPVARFEPRPSQQRIRRKNRDLEVRIQTPQIDKIRTDLFEQHKLRFQENIPESLASFLGDHPEKGPTPCLEFGVYNSAGRLLAASWLDVGAKSVSSIYALFDPKEARRSLGLFTMLEELRYAQENGKQWYYSGYSYDIPSPYDYKKRFIPLERFDWKGRWPSVSTE
jgi:leucyl-tRNA---protein transferase